MVGVEVKTYADKKVAEYLREDNPGRVCLFFWHGLGDALMFANALVALRNEFPDVVIDLALQDGVGQEWIFPDAILVSGAEQLLDDYDFVFHVHFPMSEFERPPRPKAEKCCEDELGIAPECGHPVLPGVTSPFVGFSFHATALPDHAGATPDVAERMWAETEGSGLVPIEVMMEHVFHNPQNGQLACTARRTLRGLTPRLAVMAGVVAQCAAFVGASSGPLHLALSLLPANRVGFIQRKFDPITVTRQRMKVFDVDNYQDGDMARWLTQSRITAS